MKNLFFLACFLLPILAQAQINKILFGSCAHQDKPMPILHTINRENSDLFIFLGDNIYGDTEDMKELAAKYNKLGANPGFKTLTTNTEVIATWDDHDFGENDAGSEYSKKFESKKIMLDFWGENKLSERYLRDDGIYTSYTYGKGDNTIQVILLDLRFNRSPLNRVSKSSYINDRKPNNMGPYSPVDQARASMLGEKQWQWLETELKKPAKIKLIGSSLQLLADFTGWEAWANFPFDRNRLFDFIKNQKINGVMLLSGDTHWGEVSKYEDNMPYPLWEVTSSGLTEEWKEVSPNKHRVGKYTHKVNYGFIDIDWSKSDPLIHFGLKNINGAVVNSTEFALSTIRPFDK